MHVRGEVSKLWLSVAVVQWRPASGEIDSGVRPPVMSNLR